jgi:uncharacterized protein Yka (UPF0111/DUF47 family)
MNRREKMEREKTLKLLAYATETTTAAERLRAELKHAEDEAAQALEDLRLHLSGGVRSPFNDLGKSAQDLCDAFTYCVESMNKTAAAMQWHGPPSAGIGKLD